MAVFLRHGLPPLNAVTSPISGAGRSGSPYAVTPAEQVVAVQETSTRTNKIDANNPQLVSKTNSKLAAELGGVDQLRRGRLPAHAMQKTVAPLENAPILPDRRRRSVREGSKAVDFDEIDVTDF